MNLPTLTLFLLAFAPMAQAVTCTFSVSPDHLEFQASSGTVQQIQVVASDVGCTNGSGPTITASWLHPAGGSSINNVSMFGFTADTNTGGPRSTSIAVVGYIIPVLQDAGMAPPPASLPTFTAQGIVSAASFQNAPLTPGEIITIFGTNLGPTTPASLMLTADGTTLLTSIGGVQVLFDDEAAPMIFASMGQVSAIVPYDVSSKTVVNVQVEYGQDLSTPVSMPVAISFPALFTVNSSGTGQGAFLNKDGTVNSATNSAHVGDYLVLFGTGEGLSDPLPGNGAIISATALPHTQLPVTVTIGGVAATVTYAGGAPGLTAGLLQVNVTIPSGITVGTSVPVILTVGTAVAPTVTAAIVQP